MKGAGGWPVGPSNAERGVFFPAAGQTLFGVFAPAAPPRFTDLAVVVLPEGIPAGMRGQNAVVVHLARAVADAGFTSFRLDYHGIGESSGPLPVVRRDDPFLDDVDGALEWLRAQGYERFVLVGSCFGAHTALLAVPGRPHIRGVALLSCLIAAGHDPGAPPSQLVLQSVAEAAEQGVDVLFCFGRDDASRAEFEVARPLGLDPLLAASSIDVQVLDGLLHSFLDVNFQPRVINTVVRWLQRVADERTALAPLRESWTTS
jgi:alpha/beta superfamily hydrolase